MTWRSREAAPGRIFEADPYFGFPRWGEEEGSRGIRSCFYLFVRMAGTRVDLNDCKSSVRQRRFPWHVLAELQAAGWNSACMRRSCAADNLDSFIRAKHWLEERLGQPIFGLRHHYWAMNWQKPHLTFRKHVNAGFRYDTSIAWRSKEGFRSATCHPYQPFDPVYDRPLDLLELPTCLMDRNVVDEANWAERCRQVLGQVRDCGGLAVLDWHTEGICNDFQCCGWYDVIRSLFDSPLAGDAWIATPWEIAQHWQRRRMQLLADESMPA